MRNYQKSFVGKRSVCRTVAPVGASSEQQDRRQIPACFGQVKKGRAIPTKHLWQRSNIAGSCGE
ncbi:MAG: hypothetical protein LBT09_01745 [Planctomycetaceae bacterium]|nr:hypothetical protein [Planctomycetaceae bacterium]